MGTPRLTLEAKLERGRAEAEVTAHGCILWPGAKNKGGYGRVQDEHGVSWLVHRAAYHTWVEYLHKAEVVHHACPIPAGEPQQPACFNPAHLQAVHPVANVAESHERRTMLALVEHQEEQIQLLRSQVADLERALWDKELEQLDELHNLRLDVARLLEALKERGLAA